MLMNIHYRVYEKSRAKIGRHYWAFLVKIESFQILINLDIMVCIFPWPITGLFCNDKSSSSKNKNRTYSCPQSYLWLRAWLVKTYISIFTVFVVYPMFTPKVAAKSPSPTITDPIADQLQGKSKWYLGHL